MPAPAAVERCDLVRVAVDAPVASALTYAVPPDMPTPVAGARVRVPLGGRRSSGVVLGPHRGPPPPGLRALTGVLDVEPLLSRDVLALVEFAASYYRAPPGELVNAALPPGLGALPGTRLRLTAAGRKLLASALLADLRPAELALLRQLERGPRARRALLAAGVSARVAARLLQQGLIAERTPEPPSLAAMPLGGPDALDGTGAVTWSVAQRTAIEAVTAAIAAPRFEPFLLFGVTASGKTEVYLAAAQAALAAGRGALVLVPEIALTPQLVGRFRQRLGAAVEVLHSGLARVERRQRWLRIWRGEARCAVGVRSAVFAPVRELGLIVVDEEHEPSYKQEESPRYHARDLALYRARQVGCPAVLGSATPSLESWQRAVAGQTRLLRLPDRVGNATPPAVEVVPIRPHGRGDLPAIGAEIEILTPALREALEQTLARREQAILLLNRRGFAHFVLCLDCGQRVGCPNCSVTLTLHRRAGALLCHYCNHRAPVPERCERCGGLRVVPFGVGSERLENEVARLFPGVRAARLDRDTVRRRGELARVLRQFAAHQIDVLVGTQMLAKGHDYPRVTLVGVVVADTSLALADFRAAERTVQLLAQVAGRAGRGEQPGRVIIQAFDTSHPAICAAAAHDYRAFVELELAERRLLNYPPFRRLAVVRLEGADESTTEATALGLVRLAADRLPRGVEVLGPAPAPLARLKGVYRFQLLVKSPTASALQQALGALLRAHEQQRRSTTRLVFDVDPALVL
ncbi:MAG: primosomal protein N' [Deltaproteobacteria bacterium]|nr:primosomal protein N' [Deltaproteobacteria bacterium]